MDAEKPKSKLRKQIENPMKSTFHQTLRINTFETKLIAFPSELYMEGLIIQNSKLIAFQDGNAPEILSSQFSFRANNLSRIDMIIKNDEHIGILELKKGNINQDALNQVKNYLNNVETIISKLVEEDLIDNDSFTPQNSFGLLVGTGIEDDVLKNILNENAETIKIYVIIIQQHKTENDQLFMTSNVLVKPKINPANANPLDFTKYLYKDKEYGKGRLVLAVIEDYISDKKITIGELNEIFPREIQGSYHIAIKSLDVEESDRLKKRYFVNNPITLSDNEEIVITNQWGIGNIQRFIDKAIELGYSITAL